MITVKTETRHLQIKFTFVPVSLLNRKKAICSISIKVIPELSETGKTNIKVTSARQTNFGPGDWFVCSGRQSVVLSPDQMSLSQSVLLSDGSAFTNRSEFRASPGHAGVGAVADVRLQAPFRHLHQCRVSGQLEKTQEAKMLFNLKSFK